VADGGRETQAFSFGDRVRVRESPATTAVGLNGLEGVVYGYTTPSVTGVSVIGVDSANFAIAVQVDDRNETLWFVSDLLEVIDRGEGMVATVAGRTFVKNRDGGWDPKP
jgi:hypothetical protein